jgi:hypothetical protein
MKALHQENTRFGDGGVTILARGLTSNSTLNELILKLTSTMII